MRTTSFLLCLLCSLCSHISHAKKTVAPQVRFAVNTPGSKPFLYYNAQTKRYQGVAVDVLRKPIAANLLQVVFIDSNRQRLEVELAERQADIFLSSKAWLSQPDLLLSSSSVVLHSSFFYTAKPDAHSMDVSTLQGKTLCTRRGFRYPQLATAIRAGSLFRMDSNSHSSMLTMLLNGRCDIAVLNNHNAQALFAETGQWAHRSAQPLNTVPLSFLVHPDKHHVLPIINHAVADFVSSGAIALSIKHHSEATGMTTSTQY